jgi:hypothetical protein
MAFSGLVMLAGTLSSSHFHSSHSQSHIVEEVKVTTAYTCSYYTCVGWLHVARACRKWRLIICQVLCSICMTQETSRCPETLICPEQPTWDKTIYLMVIIYPHSTGCSRKYSQTLNIFVDKVKEIAYSTAWNRYTESFSLFLSIAVHLDLNSFLCLQYPSAIQMSQNGHMRTSVRKVMWAR